MKKIFCFVVLIGALFLTIKYKSQIVNYLMKNAVYKENIVFGDANSYYKDTDYLFVQNTTNLYPSNRQGILNIIYSTLNRGLNEVTFYCADGYDKCIDDVNTIAEDSISLSTINNLVHPFNSYSNIYFTISDYGKVNIKVSKIYSDSDISIINDKINDITNSIVSDDMSNYDKILAFHDYIVNNTVYDSSVSIDNQSYSNTHSNTAIGLLLEGKAICSGYSDTMAIFLNMNGINNYKISSDEHIWNLVNIDGMWKHIDVTWDDPVTSNGTNILLHDFFLIDSQELFNKEESFEKDNHIFNKDLYMEAMEQR